MKEKKINIIFDASVLAFNFQKNSTRSGIFFTALNILNELLNCKDVNVYLYMSPQNYAEELNLSRGYFSRAVYLHDFSSYVKAAVAKLCMFFWKIHEKYEDKTLKRKCVYLLIFLCRVFFLLTVKNKPQTHILKSADYYFSPIYRVPKFIRKYKNIKSIVFLHDAIPLLDVYGNKVSRSNVRSHKKLVESFSKDDLFFANSKQTKNDFAKLTQFVNDASTTVVPLAASRNFIPKKTIESLHSVKKKYGIPENKKYVFSLCSLEPRKNLIRSLKAFLSFVRKHKVQDLIWVMSGAAWDSFSPMLKAEIGEDAYSFIFQTGYIDDADLPILYSNAEWFVYTSQYEGFGLPLLEAMQCGCPVVAGNASSLPEVVGDAGISVDWDDEAQHIAAYEQYYFEEKLKVLNSKKGIDRANQFSWKKSVDMMISVMKANLSRNVTKLNIVYRVCDQVKASSVNTRCFDVTKKELIKKCIDSLKDNIESYSGTLNFFCVADNCSDDIISYVRKMIPSVQLEECKLGNAASFCKCIEIASTLPSGEQVLFLEDDYLFLKKDVLNLLNRNLTHLSHVLDQKVAIMPDDYPDRYVENRICTECRVTESGHFLRIDKTTCTFATYTDVVKKNKRQFLKFIKWPKITERSSINKVWKKVPLFQPVPAWTLHCQTKSVVPIYLDFEKIRNFFEN